MLVISDTGQRNILSLPHAPT
ncbi:unnamed protein product [Acanthoscelides obtectus]|uniref:Uncharacterized protein n=1 Tax=Acanthoscelides obtectus TaxID=200917 RepID=A0A9P0KJ02_ACAOB|nr:unnamed protein product [Acanthoscelides obtectus]CAK1665197.1 hypothetical protein AOBTE_LOCUS24705 [Acanthoscelides obtectus]